MGKGNLSDDCCWGGGGGGLKKVGPGGLGLGLALWAGGGGGTSPSRKALDDSPMEGRWLPVLPPSMIGVKPPV